MALINCKECGKEVSDTANKCPHCGYKNKKLTNDTKKRLFTKHIKIISILIIILTILSGLIAFYNINIHTLSDEEKIVCEVIKKYKSSLKNPDSLKIYEIRFRRFDDGSGVVMFDTSGENGYGGTTRNIVMYATDKNGLSTYIGNDSNANNSITKYTSSVEKTEIIMAMTIQSTWEKRDEEEMINIDIDKIIKNL